jgi:hypothetical protein
MLGNEKSTDEMLVELENAKYELNLARKDLYKAVSDFINDPYEESLNRLHTAVERYQSCYDRVFFLEEARRLKKFDYIDLTGGEA